MTSLGLTSTSSPRQIAPARRWVGYAILSGLLSAIVFGVLGFVAFRCWPRELLLPRPRILQTIDSSCRVPTVKHPDRVLIGNLAEFDDGLFAYLMFDHYRSQPALAGKQLMLISYETGGKPMYRLAIPLPDDLAAGVTELAELREQQFTSDIDYDWVTEPVFQRDLHQTKLFVQAYKAPVNESLNHLHPRELEAYLRHFIRFKSLTDPRVRQSTGPVPSPLTSEQASRLAADMIAVSKFYDVPLELLLGIGAMENNYLDVAGDLNNTVWKRRVQPDDVVLRRRRGRFLILNNSFGVWQITRQSLRYAHKLYLEDKRDYYELPRRLIPPMTLDPENLNPEVLTTYAGLLLRDLLDKFHDDVFQAAGAYNGTVEHPNFQYAAGVEMVAEYARRVIGCAAELDRLNVSQTSVSEEKIKTQTAQEQ
ncbi:MAG TPA: hypothetical protein VFB14_20660 [Bryobacteraceae bacterium]|nr:hypothetical protein [Bryobacteraceae bacterium]